LDDEDKIALAGVASSSVNLPEAVRGAEQAMKRKSVAAGLEDTKNRTLEGKVCNERFA